MKPTNTATTTAILASAIAGLLAVSSQAQVTPRSQPISMRSAMAWRRQT